MSAPIDQNTEFGAHAIKRLQDEMVIWLTTVSADVWPQPRPVWFLWQDPSVYILSMPTAWKLKHIARNPHVALNFDGGRLGGDIVVMLGTAEIESEPVSNELSKLYLAKYEDEIRNIGYTNGSFLKAYSTVIKITLAKARGI